MYCFLLSLLSALSSSRTSPPQGRPRLCKLLAMVVVLALCAVPGMAATVTVTSLADDGSPGTLRSVISAAVSGDTINFGVTGTITLDCANFGTLEINKNLTISGPGASSLAVSGNHACRVFQIDSGVTATLSGMTIENGSVTCDDKDIGSLCYSGGGILNSGTLTVSNSTLSNNSAVQLAGSRGGAIFNDNGTLTVSNSTLAGNSAAGGGGIFNAYNSGTVTVSNSTLSGNSAVDFGGGGIANLATLVVSNSTLSGNSAPDGGGGIFNGGTLTLKGTIVANSPAGGNCSGAATSYGYNLSDDDSCTSSFNQTGDLNNTAAGLDPNGLQNNGGPTKTIALVAGSAAIDAIPVTPTNDCTDVAGNPVTNDQRGIPRPQGPACDIGAFEYTVPFARFMARLNIFAGTPPGFTLNAAFTLGANNSAIFPLTQPVTLIVGSYAVTVPAASFTLVTSAANKDNYVFSGTINGVSLSEQISLMGKNRYSFKASATGITPATSNPVSVTLLIGSDSGTASVKAKFQ
jgi:hypothetical protein